MSRKTFLRRDLNSVQSPIESSFGATTRLEDFL